MKRTDGLSRTATQKRHLKVYGYISDLTHQSSPVSTAPRAIDGRTMPRPCVLLPPPPPKKRNLWGLCAYFLPIQSEAGSVLEPPPLCSKVAPTGR